MASVRRLALLVFVAALGVAAPAHATLLVKSDSTGLLVQDKTGIADSVIITNGTQGGNPVYVVSNSNDLDIFKFDFQANCSQGATSDKAVCTKFNGKLNLAMAGGSDAVNVTSSGATAASVNLGAGGDNYQGLDGGTDNVFAGGGDDGSDLIDTRGGADDITFGPGADRINTGPDNDRITYHEDVGDFQADDVDSGSGDDEIVILTSFRATTISAGAGNDSVTGGFGADTISAGSGNNTVRSLAGNDRVSGGSGIDDIQTGDGDDNITVKEFVDPSVSDTVTCGNGADFVTADLRDHVSAISDRGGGTCEQVDRSPVLETPHVKLPAKTLRVAANRRVSVKLRCPGGVKELGCGGNLQLSLARKLKGGAQASRSSAVGYKIQAGKGKVVTLRLTNKDMKTLRANARRGRATRSILVSLEKGRIGDKTTVRNPRLKLR